MGSVLNLTQSEYSVVWLPAEPSVDATMPSRDELKIGPVAGDEALPGMRDARAMPRFLVAFCIGVIATLVWQSCSDAARQLVESSSLQLGGLAPVAQTAPDVIAQATFAAASLDEQRLAAGQQNVNQLAASQPWMNPTVVPLASPQEHIALAFASLQQTERHTASKISVPLPRPAPAEARKHAWRPAMTTTGTGPNAHHPVTSSTSVGSSSPSQVLSTRLDTGHNKRIRSSAAAPRSSAPEPLSQRLISASQSLASALSKITGIQL